MKHYFATTCGARICVVIEEYKKISEKRIHYYTLKTMGNTVNFGGSIWVD